MTLSLFDIGPPPPCPARFNIAEHVLATGAPDQTALLVLDAEGAVRESWRYADLARAIRGTAAGLRAAGLRRGERVALRLGNVSDFPVLFFGTILAGGIAVPTSAQLTPGEFGRLAEDMEPRFAALGEGLPAPLPPGAHRLGPADWQALRAHPPMEGPAGTGAEDPAFLVYTSGTGGRPKGVLHAQRSAWARRMMWQGWYGLEPGDRMLHAGAFNWTYTLGAGLTDPWAAGATTLICAAPEGAQTWPRLAALHGATLLAGVPGLFRQILRIGGDLHTPFASLRHGLTAGERMPPELAAQWRARTGRALHEALGMSEISTYVSSCPAAPARPGTAGRPQPGRRVAVLGPDGQPLPVGQDGALAVSRRDPGLMLGYWRAPQETAAAMTGEWFLTGDRARMDARGHVTHLGRSDEVMTSLGYRVSPREVEEALAPHPAIAELAVAELPVRPDLALIAAFVVVRGDWPGEEALDAWAAARLAAYKCPRIWVAVPSLPRGPNGKLLRRALVEAHRRDGGERDRGREGG